MHYTISMQVMDNVFSILQAAVMIIQLLLLHVYHYNTNKIMVV